MASNGDMPLYERERERERERESEITITLYYETFVVSKQLKSNNSYSDS